MESIIRIEAENFSNIDTLFQPEDILGSTVLSLVHLRNTSTSPDVMATATTQFGFSDGQYNVAIAYFDEGDGAGDYQISVDEEEIASFTTLTSFTSDNAPSLNNYTVNTVAEGINIYSTDDIAVSFTTNAGESRAFDYVEFTRVGDAPPRTTAQPLPAINFGTEKPRRFVGTTKDDVLEGSNRGGNRNESFRGRKGNDEINGKSGNDRIFGGIGNDNLNGGNGQDLIRGEKGSDTLIGGRQNDVLIGGAGQDTLEGGTGKDTFVYKKLNEGRDTIVDFDVNKDVMDFRGILSGVEFQARSSYEKFDTFIKIEQIGSDTRVSIDSDGIVGTEGYTTIAILEEVKAETVVSSSFVI